MATATAGARSRDPNHRIDRGFAVVVRRIVDQAKRFLPLGRSLPDQSWRNRHRVIAGLVWVHAVVIPIYGMTLGFTPLHSFAEGSVVTVGAIVASSHVFGRRVRSAAATIGVLSSSAILVHLSGGLIEMHFHFFVMVALVALYQDWFPFLAAIGYVLLHHGVMGAIAPESVYNHLPAITAPWKWAGVHAFFIAGISAVCIATWRMNEDAMAHVLGAEEELRDTLSVLEATLESTADGILVVNNEGAIVNSNDRFAQMWRIPQDVLDRRDDDEAISFVLDQLSEPDAFLRKVKDLYGDMEAESLDELEFKDGRVFERFSKPQNVGGHTVGRVWSFRDITTRKETERTLRSALKRDQEAVERLKALDEAKNRFMSAVSHELRTPLTSVVGVASVLRNKGDRLPPEKHTALLDRLIANTGRLEQMLLDLFDLDRMSRGILEPRFIEVDLADLVSSVVQGVDFHEHPVDVDLESVFAAVDRGMIERVVENLLANAAKHTSPGTAIGVTVRRTSDEGEIVVCDRGPGVSEELKEAVFEPFKQGETPAHAPGTGIGLALVRQFVDLHSGTAWVDDRPGGGAEFHVRLPLVAISQNGSAPDTEPDKVKIEGRGAAEVVG